MLGKCSAASVVQEDVGQYVTARTEVSGLFPFVQTAFVQLLQKAAAPVWIRGLDSEDLSRGLGHIKKRTSLLVSTEEREE